MASPGPAGEARKTVTAVFCDVTGSTSLVGRLDAEASRTVMEEYFAAVGGALSRHGGTVEKFVGDAVMAVFGVPVAHEDDALRACRATLEILDAVRDLDEEVAARHGVRFAVRVGVETGEVLVGDPSRGSTFVSGAAVNIAARLEQAASAGEGLLGPDCYRLVRDRVEVEKRPGLVLKGVPSAVDAFRLLSVGSAAGDEGPPATSLVGRHREMALLRQAFDRAVGDRTCQLATVLGVAGMGKTRLTAELLPGLEHEATVLRGRCVSYGDGVTYWPLVEAVRQAAGLTGAETEAQARDRLAGLLTGAPDAGRVVAGIASVAGLGGRPGAPEDTAWALRRLLEELARERPVVLVVDDVHWAEPGLVKVLDDVGEMLDAPVLVIVLARPEFLDDHPTWGARRTNAVTALLRALDPDAVELLTAELLGGLPPDPVSRRIRDLAGGNPLYLEHLLAMLVEDGVLLRDRSGWALNGDLRSIQVPATISALIAARLDRLSEPEREVLGTASVIGQLFYLDAATEMSSVPDVPTQLRTLLRKGILRRATSDVPDLEAFRFDHVLVRDSAYASLPKRLRADLHERFARWLDAERQGQAYDGFVGGHLEAAYLSLADLGALDERARELGKEASDRLAAAGRLLLWADDDTACALLERADRLRDDQGPSRWELRIELVETWQRHVTDPVKAGRLAAEVLAAAEQAGDVRWAARAKLLRARARQMTHPGGSTEAIRREAEAAPTVLEGDHAGLATAHEGLFSVANMTLDLEGMTREANLAALHTELAGRNRQALEIRTWVLGPMTLGALHAEAGLAESRRLLAANDDRYGEVVCASSAGFFAFILGRPAEAEETWSFAERRAAEVRSDLWVPVASARAVAAIHTGDWANAKALLTRVTAFELAANAAAWLSTDAAAYAHVLLHLGAVEAARGQVVTAQRTRSIDDVYTNGLVAGARGWLAALEARPAEAREQLAMGLAMFPDDMLLDRGLTHITGAEVETLLGDTDAARAHRQAAVGLYEAKGNVVGAARQRALL